MKTYKKALIIETFNNSYLVTIYHIVDNFGEGIESTMQSETFDRIFTGQLDAVSFVNSNFGSIEIAYKKLHQVLDDLAPISYFTF